MDVSEVTRKEGFLFFAFLNLWNLLSANVVEPKKITMKICSCVVGGLDENGYTDGLEIFFDKFELF